jgi:hypothetical protein
VLWRQALAWPSINDHFSPPPGASSKESDGGVSPELGRCAEELSFSLKAPHRLRELWTDDDRGQSRWHDARAR